MGGNINIPCEPEQDRQRNYFHLDHKLLQASGKMFGCVDTKSGGHSKSLFHFLETNMIAFSRLVDMIAVLGLLEEEARIDWICRIDML